MKKFSMSAVYGVLLILLLFPVSAVMSKDKQQEDKQALTTKQQFKESVRKTDLPDLVVTELRMDKSCELTIILENKGKGSVAEKDFKNAVVAFRFGKISKTVPLSQLDRNGMLQNPQTVVNAETSIKIEKAMLVTVTIDSTKKIKETSDGNNSRKQKLSPKCEPPGEAARTKNITTKAGTQIPEQSNLQPISAAGISDKKTDSGLTISKLILVDNEVVVELRRFGRDKLKSEIKDRSRLQIKINGKTKVWPLAKVDPGFRKLNTNKRMVKYNTGIILDKGGIVHAELLGVQDASEKSAMLRPRPGPQPGNPEFAEELEESVVSTSIIDRVPREYTHPGMSSSTSMSDLVAPDFPARITSVTAPVYVGTRFTVRGEGFGNRQGRVRWAMNPPLFDGGVTDIQIDHWADTVIQATITGNVWGRSITEPRDSVIHVWPTAVAEREFGRPGDGPPPYAYSGIEGPMYPFQVIPFEPVFSRLSSDEINEGETFTITGRNFGSDPGDWGEVRMSGISHSRFEVESWGNATIRIRIDDDVILSADADSVMSEITVVNNHNKSVDCGTIRVNHVNNVQLELARVVVSDWDWEDGTWPDRHISFRFTAVVRNVGTDRFSGRIRMEAASDRSIASPRLDVSRLDPGTEISFESRYLGCDDDPCRVGFRIFGGPSSDSCSMDIAGNGTNVRPATCP